MFWAYLFTRLDVVSEIVGFVTGGAIIVVSISLFIFLITSVESFYEEDTKKLRDLMKNALKYGFNALIIATVIHCLVPNTKPAAFIWIAPKIVENGEIKETAANIPELAKLGTEYLKEVLKEKIENKGSE